MKKGQNKTPMRVFKKLLDAVRADNPKAAVKQLLMMHRGSPYFEELFDEAKTMLCLEKYRRDTLRRKKRKQSPPQ